MKEALASVLPDVGLEPGNAHPSSDELAAYHDGELPPAEAARVQDHLLLCENCTELLLDLEALRGDPGFGGQRPAPAAEIEAVLRGLRAQAARSAPAPLPPTAAPPRPRERPRQGREARWLRALAASLLVAVGGLSLWVANLRGTVGDFSRPQLNAPILDLSPGGARSEDAHPTVLRLPRRLQIFTLVLNPASPQSFPGYNVEIEREGGGVVWSGGGLEKNAFGSFSLALPRVLVPDGAYTIRLFGHPEGRMRGEPLGEYHFKIETL